MSSAQSVLTERRREVLALICRGASNKEIARKLTVTESTVEKHVGNLLRLTGARNRAELVAWALTLGAQALRNPTPCGSPPSRTNRRLDKTVRLPWSSRPSAPG